MELTWCSKWSTFTGCVLIWTCLLKIAQSCTCLPKHPQQHYCESDYAIRATVIDSHVVWPSADHIVRNGAVSLSSDVIHSAERAYKVIVSQVYKGDDIHRNQVMYLYTPYQEILCGIGHLDKGMQFLFMGSFDKMLGKHSFNLCNYHHKWSEVTPKQVEGLRHAYKNNCHVKIVTCGIDASCSNEQVELISVPLETTTWHSKDTEQHSVCQWDPWKGTCQLYEAICKKHHHTGHVYWDLSPDYELCQASLYPGVIDS
ncbi:metalloproteinase inhibitor 3-like [Amphiura filiformis]|uniref:metalloproteinase inhibitor 3-like n=1 Tax=Amphiura filiformis TaxID=82378 RepID=UPI003B222152